MIKKTALAIISFNRPSYLKLVLESIKTNDLKNIDVYFFQDGFKTFKGESVTEESLIKESLKIFNDSGIKGEVKVQDYNLSVALHFDYIERFLFLDRNYQQVIFFEDDLTLQPNYISTLMYMFDKYGEDERVGMISAYGANSKNTLENQEQNKHKLYHMHHNWGFGITRKFWLKRQPLIDSYLEYFCYNNEYRKRDGEAIRNWLRLQGFSSNATSQDYIKQQATKRLKAVRITCYPNLGKYIGEKGLHCTPSLFKKMGFGEQNLYVGEVNRLEELTDSLYQELLNES